MPFSTQQFLKVEQVKDGVLILKDHTLRGIMMVSSLNFALKSKEEQDAIIYQFQTFLNSIDFSCQILISSRKLNITGYLDKIKELEAKQKNELLKIQTNDYRNLIKKLVSSGSIMNKSFYLIVPFYLSEAQENKGGIFNIQKIPILTQESFQRAKTQLYQRMEFLALGLRRCGLWSIALNTEEIIELLWSINHPKEAETGYYPEVPPELLM